MAVVERLTQAGRATGAPHYQLKLPASRGKISPGQPSIWLGLSCPLVLAVAATSQGYAAAHTDSTPYAVDAPPAQPASCASTPAATSKAEADSATSATATKATTSAATSGAEVRA